MSDEQQQYDGLSQDNPPGTDTITAADEAADRLISGQSWHDWVAVGHALLIGRTQAMASAVTNRPDGKRYASALNRWLNEHPKLDKLLGGNPHKALRSRLLDLIDHISDVEAWRLTVPTNHRLKLNYPITVWKHWQRKTADPNKQRKPSPIAKLKESVFALEEENQRLKEANGGNTFTAKDKPADVVRLLRDTFSPNKLKEIRQLLAEKVKEQSA
jgi:hypothetical protein